MEYRFWNTLPIYQRDFFEGFLGRIRNLEKNFPFAVIFRLFLGSFEGEGGAFLDLGSGKNKDFLA